MSPEEAIEAGIEIIERDGWHQGGLYDQSGCAAGSADEMKAAQEAPVCAMGALYRAVFGVAATGLVPVEERTNEKHQLFEEAFERLGASVKGMELLTPEGTPVWSVPYFNDAVAKSKEDVLLMMKKAVCDD